MNDSLKAVLAAIPQQPQRQDATNDQLGDLAAFANKLGLYDAADLLRNLLANRSLNPAVQAVVLAKKLNSINQEPVTPARWKHTNEEGIHKGASFIAIRSTREALPAEISKIADVIRDSDWSPMIKSTSNHDLPDQMAAYVIELWSESDSIDFLNTRFNLAVPALSSRLSEMYPDAVVNGDSLYQALRHADLQKPSISSTGRSNRPRMH